MNEPYGPPEPDRTIRISIVELPEARLWRWSWSVDEGFTCEAYGHARTRAKATAKAEKYAHKIAARRVRLDAATRISYEWEVTR